MIGPSTIDVYKRQVDKGVEGVIINNVPVEAEQSYTVPTTSAGGYYYYQPTTDTKADDTKGSPKTFDAGVGIYAVTAVPVSYTHLDRPAPPRRPVRRPRYSPPPSGSSPASAAAPAGPPR